MHLSGETGSLLWGQWIAEVESHSLHGVEYDMRSYLQVINGQDGSEGTFQNAQLLSDAHHDSTGQSFGILLIEFVTTTKTARSCVEATIEVVNAKFFFASCGIRSISGVCVRLAEAAQV